MRKPISWMILLGALSAFASSCADTGRDEETPACNEGASVCTSTSSVKECKGGKWEETQCPASNTCNINTNKCEPSTSSTIPGPSTQDPQNPQNPDNPENPQDPTQTGCSEETSECIDNNTVQRCQSGQWVYISCPLNEICQEGVCTEVTEPEPTDDCTANETACVDDHTAKKCEAGRWVEVACESNETCQDGVCAEVTEPKPADDCTAGEKACIDDNNAKKCDKGKWVTVACKSNETCQEGVCKQTSTQPEKCTENEVQCVDASHEKKCVKGEWKETACDSNESCKENGCSPNVEPEEVLTTGTKADVGKKCDLNHFTDNCEDNIIIYCNGKGRIDTDDRCELYREYSFVDMRCHVIDGIAGCVYYDDDGVPDTCTKESDTITCNDAKTVAYHEGCGKAEDGKLYVKGQYEFSEVCAMECKDGVGCVEIPESERCDIATHVETCENNKTVSCVNGRLVKTDCGKQTCHSFASEGIALCTDNKTCETAGLSNTCRFEFNASGDDINAFLDNFMCAKAEDKKYYQYLTETTSCPYDCIEGIGCVEYIKGAGDECNEDTYEEQCRDKANYSAALACIDGTVEAIYCGKGKTCLNEMDSPTYVTGCYDDSSICEKGSASYTKCSGDSSYSATMTYECKLMSDNKYHFTPNTDTIVSCSKGCNTAGTKCK